MWTLARKLLLHDRLRFAVAIAGVSVSVMLVLVQVGLYFGFMDTASSIIDASTRGHLGRQAGNESFEFATPFDERAFYKVASVPGVERAERVLMNFAQFKLADGGDLGVQVVGIETDAGHAPLLAPWNVDRRRRATGSPRPARSSSTRASTRSSSIDRVGHIDRGHRRARRGRRADAAASARSRPRRSCSPTSARARSFLPQPRRRAR